MSSRTEEEKNLVKIFQDCAVRYRGQTALKYYDEGKYRDISWPQWAGSVQNTALALYALGVRKGDRVGLLAENRPEWTFADLGILSLGAVVVPIYPTSSFSEIAYIVNNAGIETLFVATGEQLQTTKKLFQDFDRFRHLICFDLEKNESARILSMKDFLRRGQLESLNNPDFYRQSTAAVECEDLATLIYTSGTTGPPKGVMLTHHNFVMNYLSSKEVIPVDERDTGISFLPLSHIFERLAGYYFAAFQGVTIAYARNMKTVPEDMRMVRPTLACAVPRFYEKVYAGILEKVEASSPLVQKIFSWSVRVGREAAKAKIEKKSLTFSQALKYQIAKIAAFNKLKKALGGRIRFFISGGAPLQKELAEFFFAADVLILEGYGLTETSPVMTVNSPDHLRFGTVGRALAAAEVKIAEDGEVLTKGPCVMRGYYQNEEATREAIHDGWFHTGDIGELDSDGFLKITDRKKDIIVTSGGKNIAPQNIEGLILRDPLFSQAIVVGDKRNYLVALVSCKQAEVEKFAKEQGVSGLGWTELIHHEQILNWVQSKINVQTQDLPVYEQVKYTAILAKELTQEAGELTPTLKVKRRHVMEKYQTLIDGLYKKGEAYQPRS